MKQKRLDLLNVLFVSVCFFIPFLKSFASFHVQEFAGIPLRFNFQFFLYHKKSIPNDTNRQKEECRMPFDGMLLHRELADLKELEGAKIGKIQSLSEEEVLLYLHKNGTGSRKLALNVHSNTCRVYVAQKNKDVLPNPTGFVMLLRKRIGQGIIESIEQMGYDRILRFHIRACNELSDYVEYDLYAELMGKYANLVLVDSATQTILDCLKRIPVYENSKRLLHPGALYGLPEKPKRLLPEEANESNLDLDVPLVKQVEGFSPVLSREFLYRMKNGQSYGEILNELMSSDSLWRADKEFHVLPLLHLGQTLTEVPLMSGLETQFESDEVRLRISQQCGDVFKAVDRELKKLRKKLPRLEEQLESSKEYDRMRQIGDVLFANVHLPKSDHVRLESFDDGSMLEIDLDPRYSIKDNARLYYKKYRKLKRGQQILEEQVEECRDQLEYFETLQEQLSYCSAQDVLEIRQELADQKIVRLHQTAMRRKKKGAPNIVQIRMGDAMIYAGKNNIQNNYITWQLARRGDLWFHVKDYHGSHVVLQSEHPTEAQIRFASMLAAWFSKGRQSSSVPVDYTTISQLKKVPGKGPGFVTMKSFKTIYIDPDPAIIEPALKTGTVQEADGNPVHDTESDRS